MNGDSMSITSAHAKALIEARALDRFYGEHQAVSDFNLTLHKGEVLGLLGPNGAGKSTTMQMLTGNISPSSGDIVVNGINLIENPEEAKKSIGYLPEQPPVYRDMTAQEFLSYCAKLHRIAKSDTSNLLDQAIDRCGLGDVRHKLITNLSKGFQQRVGIAQAILHQPDVVILDEPTVGLDPIQITQIRQLIRELGSDHSVILSTHILPEVQAVCDRVQIINQGKTVFSDSFKALSERESANVVTVRFSKGGNVDELSVLTGLKKVEQVTDTFFLHYQNTPKTADVFKLAVAKGWELSELSCKTESLEQIFMTLIHGEELSISDKKTESLPKTSKKKGGVS